MNAHDGTGFARMMAGDPVGAVEKFRKALELFPEHARSLVGLGAAHASADQIDPRTKPSREPWLPSRAIEGTSPPVGA